ncbi:serine-proline rich protein, partial [Penicillium diatomitis]
ELNSAINPINFSVDKLRLVAVDYLRVLDADTKSPYLSPVTKRIRYILLYFNYKELCNHPKNYYPTPLSKPYTSYTTRVYLIPGRVAVIRLLYTISDEKTRPGTIYIFKNLEPIVKLLIFREITYDLRKVLFDKDIGLLRPKDIAAILKDDTRALAFH